MEALEREVGRLQGKLPKAANNVRAFGGASRGASNGVKTLGTAIKGVLAPLAALTSGVALVSKGFSTLQRQDFAEAKFRSLGGNSKALVANLKEETQKSGGSSQYLN